MSQILSYRSVLSWNKVLRPDRQSRLASLGTRRLNIDGYDYRWNSQVLACASLRTRLLKTDLPRREYDIAVDTQEPQQIISFASARKSDSSYVAEDPADHEVSSFTLGAGNSDWGPLTIYALMKSGDVYSICPYLPQNA